jgi:hypothetical protein
MELNGQIYGPAVLPPTPPGQGPLYSFGTGQNKAQSRSERCGQEKKSLPRPEIEPRSSSPAPGNSYTKEGTGLLGGSLVANRADCDGLGVVSCNYKVDIYT